VSPIPPGYPVLTPYICVQGAAEAIEFYERVFGASERMRIPAPDGRVGHAELQIRDSVLMLSDEYPEMGVLAPATIGGSPVTLSVYVDDVDAVVAEALEAGATLLEAVEDRFYGDRSGQIQDPFGHRWSVGTHIEDVPPEEMARRAAAMMGG
jgi:PhnB protein